MEMSQSIVNISKAMLLAQMEIEGATKDSKNPFFRSNYSGLPEVIASCKPQLNKYGVVVSQWIDSDDLHDYLITMFVHADSGEWMRSKKRFKGDLDGVQSEMSYQTYLRRYMLQAAAFVPAVDDDGEEAMGRKSAPAPKVEKKVTKVEAQVPAAIQDKVVVKIDHESPVIGATKAVEPTSIPTFSKKAVAKPEPKPQTKSSAFDD